MRDPKTARLTQLNTSNSLQNLQYQNDKVGNIKAITDKLHSERTRYTYDANGNMLSRGSNAFQYDYENRLTSASVGGVTTQYGYNGDGGRVKQTVSGVTTYYVGNWFEVKNGVVTKYYYFGAQRVAMKQGTGNSVYLHGDHPSTSLRTGTGFNQRCNK